MDVQPVGRAAIGPETLVQRPANGGAPSHAPPETKGATDGMAPLVEKLASPQLRELILSVERPRPEAAMLRNLLGRAETELAAGDLDGVLRAISEYIAKHPEGVGELMLNSAFASISDEVRGMVQGHAEEARVKAKQLIGAAAELVARVQEAPHGVDPGAVLALAERLMESGQLVNYLRAADVSEALVDLYVRSFPYLEEVMSARGRPKAEDATRSQFASLNLVLAGWLLIGGIGAMVIWLAKLPGYELMDTAGLGTLETIWGLGVVALVVLRVARGIREANSGE